MKAAVNLDPNHKTAEIIVRLSERNLLSLLSKLAVEESAKTLINADIDSGDGWSGTIVLQAECDCIHYTDRLAGRIHERDEATINILQQYRRDAESGEGKKPCNC